MSCQKTLMKQDRKIALVPHDNKMADLVELDRKNRLT
jgi:methylglyoxal synthase